MRKLGVEPDALSIEMDTGAMLRRTYHSDAADLVLVCNRVTDVLEVLRVTPDAAQDARLDASPLVEQTATETGAL